MKHILTVTLAVQACLMLSNCSSSNSYWTDSSPKREPKAGQVGRRIYEANGHRYLEERRVISTNPFESVVTTTQLAENTP